MARPRIAIIGAGPVGLEAALAALDSGFPFTVYEAAERPASHVRQWGHVGLFSPWSLDVSERMRGHLDAVGHSVPDGDDVPTGSELVERVLDPIAALDDVSENLRLGTRVVRVAREGMLKNDAIGSPKRGSSPFRLLLADASGREWVERADVVLDCSGTYGNPNSTGDGGIPAPGETGLGSRISRWLPNMAHERERWAGCTTLLVGAGHSAQTAARDLVGLAEAHPRTRIVWSIRRDDPVWEPIEDDPLPQRSTLARDATELARRGGSAVDVRPDTVVESLTGNGGGIVASLRRGRDGTSDEVRVDRILSLTGYVGDDRLYRALQVHECYATSGPMNLAASLLADPSADCLDQEAGGVDTLRNPEPDFFILGVKSFGRNSTFLMRSGWQQVEEIFERGIGSY